MVLFVGLTDVQGATIFNAIMTFFQFTLPLLLVVVILCMMLDTYPAISWSHITRTIHSSAWPSLLRADSASSSGVGRGLPVISHVGLFSAILIAVSGIITPLGLGDGPVITGRDRTTKASYLPDSSAFRTAISPRGQFVYGRRCALGPQRFPCPGMQDLDTVPQISSSTLEAFHSTKHSPFNVEFRQYFNSSKNDFTIGRMSIIESQVLREDMFALEGLVVDLSVTPGIGFWNHSVPSSKYGGTWSQDILWLEPLSTCVDTNMTFEFRLANDVNLVDQWTLVDNGGFSGLPEKEPTLIGDDQSRVDLYSRAMYGAYLANSYAMDSYNLASNQTSVGNDIHLHSANETSPLYTPGYLGTVGALPLAGLANPTLEATNPELFSLSSTLEIACQNYTKTTPFSISNPGVHCSLFLGAPSTLDGGDPSLFIAGTRGKQRVYSCASVTRASIQTVEYSWSGKADLKDLQISRRSSNDSVCWATEKTDMTIAGGTTFWGRVDTSFENDPSLSTIQQPQFYLPASLADLSPDFFGSTPLTIPGAIWAEVVSDTTWVDNNPLYSGSASRALFNKWQSILTNDPQGSPARILNAIWTDMAANALMGSDTVTSIRFLENRPSSTYNMLYGIPFILLLLFWISSFIMMIVVPFKGLRPSHLRELINQTSVGRIATGDSALVAHTSLLNDETDSIHVTPGDDPQSSTASLFKKIGWAQKIVGEQAQQTPVLFDESRGRPAADRTYFAGTNEWESETLGQDLEANGKSGIQSNGKLRVSLRTFVDHGHKISSKPVPNEPIPLMDRSGMYRITHSSS